MLRAGIDIGSTASKVAVMDEGKLLDNFVIPTGWNCKDTAQFIYEKLGSLGFHPGENILTAATGYGRISVAYADKVITEISCHGKGAYYLFGKDCCVIDIGGQDTKVISVENGAVSMFSMNDKCAAGTGKFLEVMSARLGLTLPELFELATSGKPVAISAVCTVFAESEIIGHISAGAPREDIAAGAVDSVLTRVSGLCAKHEIKGQAVLTGGLSGSDYVIKVLSKKLGKPVESHALGRFAGAIGAALSLDSRR